MAAGPVRVGTTGIPASPGRGGSAPEAPVPAGDVPGRTWLGATGPWQPSATATHAARRAGTPRLRQLTRSSCSAPRGRFRPGVLAASGRFRPDVSASCGRLGPGIPASCSRFGRGVPAASGRFGPGVPAASGRLGPGVPAASGRLGPGVPASLDCGRPGRRSGSRWSARPAHSATRPGLRIPRGRPFSPVRRGPRNRSAARITVGRWPPAPARGRPGWSGRSARSGTSIRVRTTAAGARKRRMAAPRPRLHAARKPRLRAAG